MRLFLKHSATGTRYEILKIDKAAGTVRLKGKFAEFDEPYDPVRFKQIGYELEREHTGAAA